MGFEPMNTGFADQRVSHFAIGAFTAVLCWVSTEEKSQQLHVRLRYCGCVVVRRYGFTVL